MASNTPTDPSFPIPSTEGVVGKAGTQPLPPLVDLNRDGIADWEQKWFRDTIGGALFRALGFLFPQSPWALAIRSREAEIQALLNKGAK